MQRDWITSTQAEEYTGLSRGQLRNLCRQGTQITCEKFGRDWMMSRTSLKAYMERWYPDWREPSETKREQ